MGLKTRAKDSLVCWSFGGPRRGRLQDFSLTRMFGLGVALPGCYVDLGFSFALHGFQGFKPDLGSRVFRI